MTKVLLASVLVLWSASVSFAQSVAGDWRGTLQAGGEGLRLIFHVSEAPDGSLTATLDSVTQGALGIPVQSATVTERQVTFVVAAVRGQFVGTLNAAGDEIAGTWSQGGSIPLTLVKQARAADRIPDRRPQDPRPPYPYREEEVAIVNRAADVTLGGTLTMPAGEGPFPAAVLLTGSGAQDRDEAMAGHRPFLVLADRLARAGIAVLRLDDRGVGKSTGRFAAATMRDFVSDAETAIEYLRDRREIDRRRIGLVGHSEGGMVAPRLAVQRRDIAFVVLLAGPAVVGSDVLLEQGRLVALAMGAAPAAVEQSQAMQREVMAILKQSSSSVDARVRLRAWEQQKSMPPIAEAQMTQVTSDWFRELVAYDPAPALRQLTCPVLALDGSKDLQVPEAQNVPALRAALATNSRATVEIVPGVNHLFQTAVTGAPDEYATIDETISPLVLERVANWIVDVAK